MNLRKTAVLCDSEHSNQPCNHALAPWRRRGQDSASGHWDGGLYCSLVVRGGHGQEANWEISV